MEDKYCLNCKTKLTAIGTVAPEPGHFMENVNYECPKCGVYYREDEPVAVRKGDKVIPLNME